MVLTTDPDPRVERVEAVCRALADDGERQPVLSDLAAGVGVSPASLRRDFMAVLGITPKQYADQLRVERLRAGLRSGRDVAGAMYDAGYGSSSRLYEHSDSRLGMTPASYGASGKGATISFTTCESRFGPLLVAVTERGICRILHGPDPAVLEAILGDEFSCADIARDDALLAGTVAEVLRRIDGDVPARTLPLDVQGTAFQRRVWQELQRIPLGETRSYAEVAEAVGAPRAARAVGSACGRNPVLFVVPCHRVIASDGGLGGYGLGLDIKRRLLDSEAPAAT
jgi:AraC family transcriptional regulator, regulatory protein of adaptative response / methylated-DNA-[protein]-cysteine methyltransferase